MIPGVQRQVRAFQRGADRHVNGRPRTVAAAVELAFAVETLRAFPSVSLKPRPARASGTRREATASRWISIGPDQVPSWKFVSAAAVTEMRGVAQP